VVVVGLARGRTGADALSGGPVSGTRTRLGGGVAIALARSASSACEGSSMTGRGPAARRSSSSSRLYLSYSDSASTAAPNTLVLERPVVPAVA
jgi:hypothetical protein